MFLSTKCQMHAKKWLAAKKKIQLCQTKMNLNYNDV